MKTSFYSHCQSYQWIQLQVPLLYTDILFNTNDNDNIYYLYCAFSIKYSKARNFQTSSSLFSHYVQNILVHVQ